MSTAASASLKKAKKETGKMLPMVAYDLLCYGIDPDKIVPTEISPMPAGLMVAIEHLLGQGQCFINAYKVVQESPMRNWQYVVGYAIPGRPCPKIPLEHAWVTNEYGQHFDPTWQMHTESLGRLYFPVATLSQSQLGSITLTIRRPPTIYDLAFRFSEYLDKDLRRPRASREFAQEAMKKYA